MGLWIGRDLGNLDASLVQQFTLRTRKLERNLPKRRVSFCACKDVCMCVCVCVCVYCIFSNDYSKYKYFVSKTEKTLNEGEHTRRGVHNHSRLGLAMHLHIWLAAMCQHTASFLAMFSRCEKIMGNNIERR